MILTWEESLINKHHPGTAHNYKDIGRHAKEAFTKGDLLYRCTLCDYVISERQLKEVVKR